MGKLAERYADAARSGVYRVRDATVPRDAAVEARAVVLELDLSSHAGTASERIQSLIRGADERPRVMLIAGMCTEQREVLETLRMAAEHCRHCGRPFFAVLIDPEECLALPPLYKERERLTWIK